MKIPFQSKTLRLVGLFGPILGLLIVFQNCSSHDEGLRGEALERSLAQDSELQTRLIFENKCYECHLPSTSDNVLTDITDTQALIDVGYIVPGSPQQSPLYLDLIDGLEPQGDVEPLSGEELAHVRDWIVLLGGGGDTLLTNEDGQ